MLECSSGLTHRVRLEDEGVSEKITISEIHKKMTDLAGVEEVYSMKRLREKLLEHYGDHIFWS